MFYREIPRALADFARAFLNYFTNYTKCLKSLDVTETNSIILNLERVVNMSRDYALILLHSYDGYRGDRCKI
ncbi:MAG: hypothetical protein H7Y18_05135 [Clostridiaceae bacterium]|nr:hypothetical protein [Clostridiaceae bacterium]